MRSTHPAISHRNDSQMDWHHGATGQRHRAPRRYGLGLLLAATLLQGLAVAQDPIPLGGAARPLPIRDWIGTPRTLEDMRGKLTVIYFFFPGCGSCDEFTLHLRRLKIRHGDRLLPLGVSDRSLEELSKFAGGINRVYDIVHDGGRSWAGPVLGLSTTLPAYAVFDQDQRLIWFDHGRQKRMLAIELESLLEPSRARRDTGGRKAAVVVGIGDDPVSGRQLAAPQGDAQAVAQALTRLGVSDVTLLTDAPGQADRPTASRIREAIRSSLAGLGGDDQFVLFFSGGGLQEGLGDQAKIQLAAHGSGQGLEMIPLSEIHDLLRSSRARHLALIDIGHQDSQMSPLTKITPVVESRFDGSHIVLSCSEENEQSQLVDAGGTTRSLFAAKLLEALDGAADLRPADGVLSGGEITRHLWLHIQDRSRYTGRRQAPLVLGDPVAQDIALPLAGADR